MNKVNWVCDWEELKWAVIMGTPISIVLALEHLLGISIPVPFAGSSLVIVLVMLGPIAVIQPPRRMLQGIP